MIKDKILRRIENRMWISWLVVTVLHGLWSQIKEQKATKVNNGDQKPHVSSENMLLSERSFEAGEHRPGVSNGYHLEWTDKTSKDSMVKEEGNLMVYFLFAQFFVVNHRG